MIEVAGLDDWKNECSPEYAAAVTVHREAARVFQLAKGSYGPGLGKAADAEYAAAYAVHEEAGLVFDAACVAEEGWEAEIVQEVVEADGQGELF